MKKIKTTEISLNTMRLAKKKKVYERISKRRWKTEPQIFLVDYKLSKKPVWQYLINLSLISFLIIYSRDCLLRNITI